jgi:hypothetical protein
LFSDKQRKAHCKFARLFRTNWGFGEGKCLLIHYDKKWFWGLVLQLRDKACEERDVDKQTFRACHKSHINKTMGVSFVAFAFDDNVEDGGEAMKLAFLWAQSHKIAGKEARKAV